MFTGRFNRLKYNLSKTVIALPFSRKCIENVEAAVGGKTYKDFSRQVSEKINAKVNLVSMLKRTRKVLEKFTGEFVLRKLLPIKRNFLEETKAKTFVSKNMFYLRKSKEIFGNISHLGKHFNINRTETERILSRAIASKIMHSKRNCIELFSCETNATSTVYTSFTLDIELPPGGEIRVNSDNFTALMGLQNILHTYRGDWIYLDRDTVQIVAYSASGGYLMGELIYNERYL